MAHGVLSWATAALGFAAVQTDRLHLSTTHKASQTIGRMERRQQPASIVKLKRTIIDTFVRTDFGAHRMEDLLVFVRPMLPVQAYATGMYEAMSQEKDKRRVNNTDSVQAERAQ